MALLLVVLSLKRESPLWPRVLRSLLRPPPPTRTPFLTSHTHSKLLNPTLILQPWSKYFRLCFYLFMFVNVLAWCSHHPHRMFAMTRMVLLCVIITFKGSITTNITPPTSPTSTRRWKVRMRSPSSIWWNLLLRLDLQFVIMVSFRPAFLFLFLVRWENFCTMQCTLIF